MCQIIQIIKKKLETWNEFNTLAAQRAQLICPKSELNMKISKKKYVKNDFFYLFRSKNYKKKNIFITIGVFC